MKAFLKALGAFAAIILFLFVLFFGCLAEFFPTLVPDFVYTISTFVGLVAMIALLLWLRKENRKKKK